MLKIREDELIEGQYQVLLGEDQIGFCYKSEDGLWIGKLSSRYANNFYGDTKNQVADKMVKKYIEIKGE